MQYGTRGPHFDEIANDGGMPVHEQAQPVAVLAWWEHNGDLRLIGGVLTSPTPTCIEPEEHGFGSIAGPDDIGCQRDHVRPPFARCGQEIPEPPPRNLITEFVQRHLHTHLQNLMATIVTGRRGILAFGRGLPQ